MQQQQQQQQQQQHEAAAAQGSEIEEGVRCVQHSTAQQVTGGCA
jgi:hypothetical protein